MSVSPARIAFILLAAGASRRFQNRPKQLLRRGEHTLLEWTFSSVKQLQPHAVVVVLGPHADALSPLAARHSVRTVLNSHWESGMSSSLRCGLASFSREEQAQWDGVVFLPTDLPGIQAADLRALLPRELPGPTIRATAQGEERRPGAPAFFSSHFLAELAALEGDQGARPLFSRHRAVVTLLDLPHLARDVDTPEDWQRWLDEQPSP